VLVGSAVDESSVPTTPEGAVTPAVVVGSKTDWRPVRIDERIGLRGSPAGVLVGSAVDESSVASVTTVDRPSRIPVGEDVGSGVVFTLDDRVGSTIRGGRSPVEPATSVEEVSPTRIVSRKPPVDPPTLFGIEIRFGVEAPVVVVGASGVVVRVGRTIKVGMLPVEATSEVGSALDAVVVVTIEIGNPLVEATSDDVASTESDDFGRILSGIGGGGVYMEVDDDSDVEELSDEENEDIPVPSGTWTSVVETVEVSEALELKKLSNNDAKSPEVAPNCRGTLDFGVSELGVV
jgi:hypothetical protein